MKKTSIVLAIVAIVAGIFVYLLFGESKYNLVKIFSEKCEYDGREYSYGDNFPATDGCNSCSCGKDGLVACTLMACDSTY